MDSAVNTCSLTHVQSKRLIRRSKQFDIFSLFGVYFDCFY